MIHTDNSPIAPHTSAPAWTARRLDTTTSFGNTKLLDGSFGNQAGVVNGTGASALTVVAATNDTFTYVVTDNQGGYATGRVEIVFKDFVLTVTNIADSGPGTLREALDQSG